MPNGSTAPASDVCKLEHEIQDSARTVDLVLYLVESYLLSTNRLASAGYIIFYDGIEVNIYDSTTTETIVSEEAVLIGWRYPESTIWHMPLTS